MVKVLRQMSHCHCFCDEGLGRDGVVGGGAVTSEGDDGGSADANIPSATWPQLALGA